jgi:hypothetical protein
MFGPLVVEHCTPEESKIDRGFFLPDERVLKVSRDQPLAVQWQALFHELTHVALWDSGAHNALKGKQEEIICDAMGSFLAHMVTSGQLKLSPAWEKATSGE